MARERRPDERAPDALKNEDVTGLTTEKREAIVHESGRTSRDRAAEEMLDEQRDQAADTPHSEGATASGSAGGEHPGVTHGGEGEHEHRWVDAGENPERERSEPGTPKRA